MAFGIERRLKRDLFAYVVVDREFFEDIGRHEPEGGGFKRLIEERLQEGWRLVHEGIWFSAAPEASVVPDQGFKIHISATSRGAEKTLKRVIPVLVRSAVPFKVLVDRFILIFTNSKNYSRGAPGSSSPPTLRTAPDSARCSRSSVARPRA